MKKKSKGSYPDFDVISFLEEHQIYVRESGKNIGRNWIGIECPLCQGAGEHGGINMSSKKFSCFQCGQKRTALGLVAELLNIDFKEAGKILRSFSEGRGSHYIEEEIKLATKIKWPSGTKDLDNRGKSYLYKRGFCPEKIIHHYGLKQTFGFSTLKINGEELDFSHRILIPIIMNNKLVSFLGRDIIGDRDPKYKNSPLENSILPIGECIYNIDTMRKKKRGIFVEGPTDVWRMGDETAAPLGKTFTAEQIAIIGSLKLLKAVVLFDEQADEQARNFGLALTSVVPKVSMVPMLKGDPAELSEIEAVKLKMELLR